MKTFNDLVFKEHPRNEPLAKSNVTLFGDGTFHYGVVSRLTFDNGYGVSVVKGPYTYGGNQGLYELAVLGKDGELSYDTPIADDTIGYLTQQEVTDIMKQIQELV
jgi:hypothetical protein